MTTRATPLDAPSDARRPAPPLLDSVSLEVAWHRVRKHAHRTPVLHSTYFDDRLGAELFFKCENFQRVGAFKFRGGINALYSLTEDELSRGVVAHSSGNHAQAVALAARLRGAKATIVMPRNSAQVKLDAVRGYGARVILCEPTPEGRRSGAQEIVEREGAVMIHPYNDRRIIAGQATAARELLDEVPNLDLVMTPVGGGGLISGTALTVFHRSPATRVVGAEPSSADDAMRSLAAGSIQPVGRPDTVADGLRSSIGELTFAVMQRHVQQIVTVDDDVTIDTMRRIWERMKIVVEPSCAVPLAALCDGKLDVRGLRVGIILSGGNVDLKALPWNA